MSEKKLLDALSYHADGRPGKIEVISTKPTQTQFDLALAYSPGVAEPCLAIAANVDDVYKYTAKGNLVAVISNGTAVLGLGDIGPEASKPVMDGKGVLQGCGPFCRNGEGNGAHIWWNQPRGY